MPEFFLDLSNIYADFFLQKCHPAAGSSGLPPDELAVGATAVLQPAIAAL